MTSILPGKVRQLSAAIVTLFVLAFASGGFPDAPIVCCGSSWLARFPGLGALEARDVVGLDGGRDIDSFGGQ